MTDKNLAISYLGKSRLISSTVNSKTGTEIRKYTYEPKTQQKVVGFRKTVVLGENSPLKKLGIDRLDIRRILDHKPSISFIQDCGNHSSAALFTQWQNPKATQKEIKTFLNMLRQIATENLKPSLATVKALLQHIK